MGGVSLVGYTLGWGTYYEKALGAGLAAEILSRFYPDRS